MNGAARRPNLVPGAYRGVAVAEVDLRDRRGVAGRTLRRQGGLPPDPLHRRPSRPGDGDPRRGEGTPERGTTRCSRRSPRSRSWSAPTTVPSWSAPTWTRRCPPPWRAPPGRTRRASEGSWCRDGYGHVSFIVDPAPLRLTVREVVPPHPPKLFDQTRRLLLVAEHLPPFELVAEVVEPRGPRALTTRRARTCCRAAAAASTVEGATTAYLDERPERQRLDAGRLRAVAADPRVVLRRAGRAGRHLPAQVRSGRQRGGADQVLPARAGRSRPTAGQVVVPWGASLAQISEALGRDRATWEPTWAPA